MNASVAKRKLTDHILQSKPEVGAEYSLFGGGVTGKYVSLTPPKEIVQTWVLQSPTWPAGTFDDATRSQKLIQCLCVF